MFNSAVLNVVIGLVLIFLLYSLLATIVGEFISYRLGIRPRILRMAIERMLNDGYYKKFYPPKVIITESGKATIKKSQEKVSRYFINLWQRINYIVLLRTPKAFNTSFAGKFYDSPSVKYLARLEGDQKGVFGISKPSYFSAENFAETLCHILEEGGSGKTPYDKIIFCIKYNTLHIQPETAKHIANLLKDSKDLEAFKLTLQRWFNETMDRANGWYKSKMQAILLLLGFFIAWCFNIDTIKIAHILSRDRDASEQLTTIAVAVAKDTAHYGAFVNGSADTTHTKAILDSGLAQVNKNISEASMILGLGWDLDSLKTPHSTTVKKSKKDTYNTAIQYYKNLQELAKTANTQTSQLIISQHNLDSCIQALNRLTRDTLHNMVLKKDNSATKDSLLFAVKAINAYKNLKTLDSAQLADTRKSIALYQREILKIADSKIVYVDSITLSADAIKIDGKKNYSALGKIWYVLWSHPHSWMRFIGFLLTALAISLGAPFWFDLLNKLVNVRIAGVKPEEKKDDLNKKNLLNDAGDTVNKDDKTLTRAQEALTQETAIQEALRIYGDTIRKEPGVIRVDKGYMQDKDKKVVKCVQIDVDTNANAVNIKSKFPSLQLASENILVNVLVTGEARLAGGAGFSTANVGCVEKALANKSGIFGWGSFGCLVENADNLGQYFIVSCYHVMNGDYTWQNNGVNQAIQKNINDIVATSYQGYLTQTLDTAYAPVSGNTLAFYQNLANVDIPASIRDVTDDELFKTTVKIQGFITPLSTGVLADNSKSMQFPYPIRPGVSQKRQLDDLLVISHAPLNDAQNFIGTKRGDSGSIVLDENNAALGIVVGGDLLHTYAIKITTIFNQLGFKLPS